MISIRSYKAHFAFVHWKQTSFVSPTTRVSQVRSCPPRGWSDAGVNRYQASKQADKCAPIGHVINQINKFIFSPTKISNLACQNGTQHKHFSFSHQGAENLGKMSHTTRTSAKVQCNRVSSSSASSSHQTCTSTATPHQEINANN